MKPVSNQTYHIAAVYELDLLDCPFLMVKIVDEWHPIQTSSMTQKEVIAALPNTEWRYHFTTDEWIPLFYCTHSAEVFNNFLEMRKEDNEEYLYIKGV